jgi:hypothetical protein
MRGHDQLRDRLIETLLLLGHDVHGAWEDWEIERTDATSSQLWGSERIYYTDRDMAWWLRYRGDEPLAKKGDQRIGGRHPVAECLLPGATLKPLEIHTEGRYSTTFILGLELEPPSQEERGESPSTRTKKRSVIAYACEKCGKEFKTSRRYRHEMEHKADGGRLVFKSHEVVEA